jgi:hypothetical protein
LDVLHVQRLGLLQPLVHVHAAFAQDLYPRLGLGFRRLRLPDAQPHLFDFRLEVGAVLVVGVHLSKLKQMAILLGIV